jgi:hypothetical protein
VCARLIIVSRYEKKTISPTSVPSFSGTNLENKPTPKPAQKPDQSKST